MYDGAFFTSVKPYFKNILNLIELPLSYIFHMTQPFVKKLTTLKTSGEKVFYKKKKYFKKTKLRNGMEPSIK